MHRTKSRLSCLSLAAISLIALVSCDRNKEATARQRAELRDQSHQLGNDPATWPQIALTNRADFKGSSGLRGASGFLVRNTKGHVFYASAAHLLGSAGGVDPEVPQARIDEFLDSWVVYPRTRKDEKLSITGLAGTPSENEHIDMMLLRIEKPDGPLPAEPLQLAKPGIDEGDIVYLVGVPYSDKKSSQNIYKGVVQERELSANFRYTLETPVDLRGFSGAPILNKNGELVALMTVDFNPKSNDEGLHLEGGGQIIFLIEDRLEAATP